MKCAFFFFFFNKIIDAFLKIHRVLLKILSCVERTASSAAREGIFHVVL